MSDNIGGQKWFVMFNLQGKIFPMTDGDTEAVVLFDSQDEAETIASKHFLATQGMAYETYEAP